ncbi:MAG: hypothetical protein AAGB46_14020 [Verrucomicrobiota bacterium]
MSEKRLKELKEQKRLLEGHLAWLENEIAKEAEAAPTSRIADALPDEGTIKPRTVEALATDSPPESEPNPIEEVYNSLGPDTKGAASDAKRGCLILFGVGFAIFAAIAIGLTLFY